MLKHIKKKFSLKNINAIASDINRKWEAVPTPAIFDENASIISKFEWCIPHCYRVHCFPDPFSSEHGLPKGWSHAGIYPENLLSTYAGEPHIEYGFLTQFTTRKSDKWCGDFGMNRDPDDRCRYHYPRTAQLTAQIAVLNQYYSGLSDSGIFNYLYEVPVSKRTHPIQKMWVFKKANNSFSLTQLAGVEIETLRKVWGWSESEQFEFEYPPTEFFGDSLEIIVNYKLNAYSGGHPIDMFLGFLIHGFESFEALEKWWNIFAEEGFEFAVDDFVKSTNNYIAGDHDFRGDPWCITASFFSESLDIYRNRLGQIHPGSNERFFSSLLDGIRGILDHRKDKKFPSRIHPYDIQKLRVKIEENTYGCQYSYNE